MWYTIISEIEYFNKFDNSLLLDHSTIYLIEANSTEEAIKDVKQRSDKFCQDHNNKKDTHSILSVKDVILNKCLGESIYSGLII